MKFWNYLILGTIVAILCGLSFYSFANASRFGDYVASVIVSYR